MSFFSTKSKPPPKKTYDEVFANLVKNLAIKANQSLAHPIALPAQPTLVHLEEIFKRITNNRFRETFNYDFAGQNTSPLRLASGTQVYKTFDRFYNLKDPGKLSQSTKPVPTQSTDGGNDPRPPPFQPIPDDRQSHAAIINDFKNQITGLPHWAQDQAQNYLLKRLEIIFNEKGISDQWTEDVNTPVYPQDEKYANSLQLDCIFIKVYSALEETETKAQLSAVYCVGVFYERISDAKLAKTNLWKSLYEQANKLLDKPQTTFPDPPAQTPLEAILIWYRDNKLFNSDHGFAFKGGEPDGLIEDLGRPAHLFLFEDDDFSSLTKQIQTSILGNVKLPKWATDSVKKDITDIINALLKTSSTDSTGFISTKYDKAPPPPNKNDPALVIKGDFLHCNLIASGYSDITYRAVYFCGVFYTALSAQESVSKDLLAAVYKNALRLVPDYESVSEPTQKDLDGLIGQALKLKFGKEFSFAFDGKNTTPDDLAGNLYAGKVGFHTKTPGDVSANQAADDILNSFDFPDLSTDTKLRASIFEDIHLKTKRSLEADPISVPPNSWEYTTNDRSYSYSDSSRPGLQNKSVIWYCNGKLSAAGKDTQIMSFIYSIGVTYEKEEEDPW